VKGELEALAPSESDRLVVLAIAGANDRTR